jgi:hypothetical protein
MCDNDYLKFEETKSKCENYDPLIENKINKEIYDRNFINLLNHILNLSNIQSQNIKKIIEKKYPDIELDYYRILLDYLKKFILYINDLLKIFIKLYNLNMGLSNFIINTDFNFIDKSKDIFEEYFVNQKISDKDKEFFYKKLPKKEIFIPLEYTAYDLSILDEIKNEEDLIFVSTYFLEDYEKLKKAILRLIKITEEFKFVLDLKNVTKLIISQIIPEDYLNNQNIQVGGGDPTISEVYNKLIKLRSLLDGIGTNILEKEIPNGINIELNEALNIIKIFQTQLEKGAHTADKPADKKEYKEYDINLFQSIPSYKKIPISEDFIKDKLKPQLPRTSIPPANMDQIINVIEKKTDYFKEKINMIQKIYKELYLFKKDIDEYKIIEKNKMTDTNIDYIRTNIGSKVELKSQIDKIKIDISGLEVNIANINTNITNVSVPEFKEYILKKKEFENLTRPSGSINDKINEIKDKLFKNIPKIVGPPLDSNPETYDFIFERMKELAKNINSDYTPKFFKMFNDNTETDAIKDIDKLKKIINAYSNITQQQKITESKLKYGQNIPSNVLLSSIQPILTIIQKESDKLKEINQIIDDINNKYLGYNRKEKEINEIETNKPTFLSQYNGLDNFDFTDISGSIERKITAYTEEKDDLILQKRNKEQEISKLDEQLVKVKDDSIIDIKKMIIFNKEDFNSIIRLLQEKIHLINNVMSEIFIIKENKNLSPYNETFISENIDKPFNIRWYSKNMIGGDVEFEKYKDNIININNISLMNENIKKLLTTIEIYKTKSTDLFNIYINVMKEINNILIYLYYKLTVFNDYYNEGLLLSGKLNKKTLEELKENINKIDRKNFQFIKDIYSEVIKNIIDKMVDGNIYVSYEPSSGLLNLLILTHLQVHISNLK